jgi:hypothetical protein
MRPRARIAVVAVASSIVSGAQGAGKDASYFCASEASAGLSYNPTLKRWDGAVFRPSVKFIAKMKFIKSGIAPHSLGGDKSADQYSMTVTTSGSDLSLPCTDAAWGDPRNVWVEDGHFQCEALERYIINLNTHRFLNSYEIGYVNGVDNNENNPAMSVGTCTKID